MNLHPIEWVFIQWVFKLYKKIQYFLTKKKGKITQSILIIDCIIRERLWLTQGEFVVHGNKYGRATPQPRWNASPGWSPEGHVSLRKNSRKEASRCSFSSWERRNLFLNCRVTVQVWHMVLSISQETPRTYYQSFELLDEPKMMVVYSTYLLLVG